MTPSLSIAGPALDEPWPTMSLRTAPLAASSAYMWPLMLPAYTTPLEVETAPGVKLPLGSAVCQRMAPVAGSRAAQEPVSGRPGLLLYGRNAELASAM